jgi:predicted component of type VI protein secretion system
MIAKLIVATGKSAGRSIAIKRNKLLIGRAEQCDVRPLSEEVSRQHCEVTVGPAGVWVEDLGSRNGTFVNGDRVEGRRQVVDGDILRVGSLELKVSCSEPTRGGSEDDVSRWLMADDRPAGMSDTTRTMAAAADDASVAADASNIHVGRAATPPPAADGSFVSGIDAAVASGSAASSAGSGNSATADIEAVRASKVKPGGLPQGQAKKNGADSSRDAAAEALKKFFEKR